MTERTPTFRPEMTAEAFNRRSAGHLPGLLGMQVVSVSAQALESRLALRPEHQAPNGFLHAASIVALADTSCGYGCVAHLPPGASGFTTIELKSNFLGTARDGTIHCRASPVHLGRTTHVWDALVTLEESGARLALFRCTQLILWPRA